VAANIVTVANIVPRECWMLAAGSDGTVPEFAAFTIFTAFTTVTIFTVL